LYEIEVLKRESALIGFGTWEVGVEKLREGWKLREVAERDAIAIVIEGKVLGTERGE